MDTLFSTTAAAIVTTTTTTVTTIMGRKLNALNINSIISNNYPMANALDNDDNDDTTNNDNNNIDCPDCMSQQNPAVNKSKCVCALYAGEQNVCQHFMSPKEKNSCIHLQDSHKYNTNHISHSNLVNNCCDNTINSKSVWYLPIDDDTIKNWYIHKDNVQMIETNNDISGVKLHLSSSSPSAFLTTSQSLASVYTNVSQKQTNTQENNNRKEPIKITTATITNVPNGITVDKFFHSNLSHQFRAISTPSIISNKFIPRCNNLSISHNTLIPNTYDQFKFEPKSTSKTHVLANQKNNVGFLEKFKRTLVIFNRSHSSYSKADLSHVPFKELTSKNSTNKDNNSTNIISDQQQNDSILNMDITGTLLRRSSQEHHRNKYNRQDKCNSGDSGIQIEMENFNSRHYLQQQWKHDKKEKHNCSVRRSNSAIVLSLGYDVKAKEKSKKCNNSNKLGQSAERSSIAKSKSISQPYGLDTCGLTNGCSLDGVSINSQTDDGGWRHIVTYGKVLYDFERTRSQELSLMKGNLIEIIYKDSGPWWFGYLKEEQQQQQSNGSTLKTDNDFKRKMGWFPKDFVRIINPSDCENFYLQQHNNMIYAELLSTEKNQQSEEKEQTLSTNASTKSTTNGIITTSTTIVNSNNNNQKIIDSNCNKANTTTILKTLEMYSSTLCDIDLLSNKAIKELLETEINYVKHLAALCEGYLPVMSKRTDIFPSHSIQLIFTNITTIYKFHKKFLEALHKGIQQKQLANVFLKMHKGFLCYSIYCNSYPRALVELESYEKNKEAQTIFINCQEATNLQELPLSAHLLVPIQRICRYSLHLTEIIKTVYPETVISSSSKIIDDDIIENDDVLSNSSSKDNNKILKMALDAMKNIMETINEGKRHNESIERYQQSFQNFKGPPLHLHSTRFLLQIDATRQKQNLWNSSCTLFLFDNQIIYCKRDILKRTQFIYKGRIYLNRCRIVNVKDGKMFGHTIKNSLRIYCEMRDKWYDFSFRSANRKQHFLNTLALERQFNGKTLYVSEMTGYQYALRDGDVSDQSDYEELSNGSNYTNELKKSIENRTISESISNSSLHFDDDSSLSDSMSKFYVIYNNATVTTTATTDATVAAAITTTANPERTTTTTTATTALIKNANCNNHPNEVRDCCRRRFGNWFRRSKSSNTTPNRSPTHKSTTIIAHSTGDLEIAGTLDVTDTHNCFDNKKTELLENRTKTY